MQIISARPEHYEGIIKLQRANHRSTLVTDEQRQDGFVTVVHTVENLHELAKPVPHSIAVDDAGEVVGYIISQHHGQREIVPLIGPLYDHVNEFMYKGRKGSEIPYAVIGQVAIGQTARGKGVFRRLYDHWNAAMGDHFEVAFTEIDENNHRSRAAHRAVGYEEVSNYRQGDFNWIVVAKDLQ